MRTTVVYDHTFEELRAWMLKKLGLKSHLQANWSPDSPHRAFWNEINDIEMKRGYNHEEYLKKDSSALCQMNLLTATELREWKRRFNEIT